MNFSNALRIGFISFKLSSLVDSNVFVYCRFEVVESVCCLSVCLLQQALSRLFKLKEMNPILKALLKFCTTKSLFKNEF